MMLALVVVVWVCLLVAICNDAVEVWMQRKLDRAHRARWAEVGDDWAFPPFRGERLTLNLPMNQSTRRTLRALRRKLTKRWNVRKLLPRPKLKKNRA